MTSVTWLWAWKRRAFQKTQIPKLKCENCYTTNIFCHMAHMHQELSEILQYITQNPLQCLCSGNTLLRKLSICCQKTPDFYQSFEEREKEFIKSTFFKGSFRIFSSFNFLVFFFFFPPQKIKSGFSQFNLLYSNRMCWSSSLYPKCEVSSILYPIYRCAYSRKI